MPQQENNIILIWDRMGDYHRARWKALQGIVGFDNVFAADLGTGDGLYSWENTKSLPQYKLLSGKPLTQHDFIARIKNFVKIIRGNNIRYVCIPGYGKPEYLAMLVLSRLSGRKVLIFAESWYPGNRIFDFIKGFFLRMFVNVFLVSGTRARNHFHYRLGIPSNRINTGYSVVDNKHFSNQSEVIGHKLKIKNQKSKILLCIARFSPEKNLSMLINAFYKSNLPGNQWILQLVGGGPLKAELHELIKDNHVELMDWVTYDSLPALYQSADCFVLPSIFEPWGLVVNEAMAASLPVIVSEQCGCCPDLVDKSNGWVFDAKSIDSLEQTLNNLNELSCKKLEEMGSRSVQIITGFSPQTWSNNIVKLFEKDKC
jgi:glycosyltransferase involved in cell wall biosynthesis